MPEKAEQTFQKLKKNFSEILQVKFIAQWPALNKKNPRKALKLMAQYHKLLKKQVEKEMKTQLNSNLNSVKKNRTSSHKKQKSKTTKKKTKKNC